MKEANSGEFVDVGAGVRVGVRASAFDRLDACAVVLDGGGVIVDTNRAWRLFAHLNGGTAATSGVGVDYLDVCDRASTAGVGTAADVAAGLRAILSGERERMDLEYPCPSPTEDRWFLLQASALPVRDGAGVVLFHVDITARKQLTDRLIVLADHDSLTGLPNRRLAVRHLNEQLALALQTDQAVWVLFIDIDDFKRVNDVNGHHVGDELLVKVGIRVRHALRNTDLLCRLGGDEFVAICPGLDRATAFSLANRLRTVMSAPFQIGDIEVEGRVSVGASEAGKSSTAESLIRAADTAMYDDKRVRRLSPINNESTSRSTLAAPRPAHPTQGTHEQGRIATDSDVAMRAVAALTRSTDMILFFSADGTIEWASPACNHLLGIRPADMVGLNGIDLIHPDDRAAALDSFMSIPNLGDHVSVEFRATDSDGNVRWIEETATNLLDDPAVGAVVANLRDVTERIELLHRIELDRRRLIDAQAAAQMGSFEIDLRTGEISRSDELCRILGVPVGSVADWSVLDTVHPDDRQAVADMLGDDGSGRSNAELEYRIVRPTGEVRWVHTEGVRLGDPNAHIVAGTMVDVTDRHVAGEALLFQATHDWLTELPNPASLRTNLERILSIDEPGTQVVVAVIGIDNLGEINDICGTAAGDDVMRAVATRLRTCAEPGDAIGKIRGDEFLIARTAATADLDPLEFGTALQRRMGDRLVIDDTGDCPELSVSVGVAISVQQDSSESILADADAAMREAKLGGGDRVVVLDDLGRARATRRRNIIAALPHALEQNELRLEYQPIIDLANQHTVGFEALLRWTHPELGRISPDEFIPIAESNGSILPIGTWVLDTALQQLSTWHSDPQNAKPWIAVNVSARQLRDPQFPDHVHAAITRAGVTGEALHLEITEGVLLDDVDATTHTITGLQSLGVQISIDDFGTGYSSLSYLTTFTVDTIKIDRSFVKALTSDHDSAVVVRAILALARSLNLNVIAEGIESPAQLEALRQLECAHGQGFLWSPALPAKATVSWLHAAIDERSNCQRSDIAR